MSAIIVKSFKQTIQESHLLSLPTKLKEKKNYSYNKPYNQSEPLEQFCSLK